MRIAAAYRLNSRLSRCEHSLQFPVFIRHTVAMLRVIFFGDIVGFFPRQACLEFGGGKGGGVVWRGSGLLIRLHIRIEQQQFSNERRMCR